MGFVYQSKGILDQSMGFVFQSISIVDQSIVVVDQSMDFMIFVEQGIGFIEQSMGFVDQSMGFIEQSTSMGFVEQGMGFDRLQHGIRRLEYENLAYNTNRYLDNGWLSSHHFLLVWNICLLHCCVALYGGAESGPWDPNGSDYSMWYTGLEAQCTRTLLAQ